MTSTKKIKTNFARQYNCYETVCPGVFIFSIGQYGEGQTNDKLHNLRGKPHKVYDGAGLVAINDYDFKGNAIAPIRTYTEDATEHPDWTTIGNVDMEAEIYETVTLHDALNRPVTLVTPGGGKTNYTYDKSGLLKTVAVENVHSLDTDIVNNITYDAKGQREKIQYENGATTTYEYDAFTFRVRRIRTTRTSDNKVLQDLQYWYDPIGNITLQKDGALQAVYFDGTVAVPDNDYTYDALYRLIQAEGREHAGNNQAPDRNDRTRRGISPVPVAATDTAKMRRYMEHYEYDAVGNFIEMRHTVTGGTGNWTRYYTTDDNSNRMLESVIGSGTPESYDYDTRGNIIGGFSHLQSLAYNAENRLEKVEINANTTAYYQYDANGQRVRKTIINTASAITEIRKYAGEWEVYSKTVSSTLTLERETLHISDDTGRIALIDTRTTGSGTEPAQLLRYQYSNHLSTATLELDDAAAIISYEEYYPYGSTSFQSGRSGAEVSLKRYRYTGKERDEETGLYYHGARYYVPWLARWSSSDPLQDNMPTWSSYNYGFCNPVVWQDSTGMGPDLPTTPTNKYGEKQVYTTTEETVVAYDPAYIVNTEEVKHIPKNATGISEGKSQEQLYQFVVERYFNPGETKIGSDKFLDEKYFNALETVKFFFTHNAPAYSYSEAATKVVFNSTINALYSDNPQLEKAAVQQIEKSKDWSYRNNVGELSVYAVDAINVAIKGLFKSFVMDTYKFTSNERLTKTLATFLEKANPDIVKGVDQIVKDKSGRIVTDLDIVTDKFVIESTEGWGKGKLDQIKNRIIPNAGGREVILFGPNVGGAVEKSLIKNNIKLFRDAGMLEKYITQNTK